MNKKIFYSWQSDLPNNTNRGLIEDAAKKAAATIRSDNSLEIDPVILRDTEGHAGSPNIAETILSQIDSSDIFLADVSFIGRVKKRNMPNPNVLLELGYALKKLGKDKILIVMNTAYGGPDDLPFDLRMLRIIKYSADENSKKEAKDTLKSIFQQQFEAILSKDENTDQFGAQNVIDLMYEGKPGRTAAARHFAEEVYKLVESKQPNYSSIAEGQFEDDILVASLDSTKEIIDEYANVVSEAVCCSDSETYLELRKLIEFLIENYYLPQADGVIDEKKADYFKALAYEVYLIFLSPLVKESKFELLKSTIEKPFRVIKDHSRETDDVLFNHIASHIKLFENRRKRSNRISSLADWVHSRREVGSIGNTNITWKIISETDLILHVYATSITKPGQFVRFIWPPFCAVYSNYDKPGFILSARKKSDAERLAKLFNQETIDDLKKLIVQSIVNEGKMIGFFHDSSIRDEHIEEIGSI